MRHWNKRRLVTPRRNHEPKHPLRIFALLIVGVLGVSGCSVLERYDKAGAAKLAQATGLGSDTPPGFTPSFAGAVPDGTGGPALAPTSPGGGVGGFWLLADGGKGLSEETMISFYTERMMQHSLDYIYVSCTGPGELPDSEQSRNVWGWGSGRSTRFHIPVSWAGTVETGWHLNQELVVNKKVRDYPKGKVLEFRCRFINDTVLLNLAAKYGYTAKPIPRNAPLVPSKKYR